MHISQFQLIVDKWSEDYNNIHPYDSLSEMNPREFGKRDQHTLRSTPKCVEGVNFIYRLF